MPRLNKPIRKTTAIFVKEISEGKCTYVREAYNNVSLDWGDGSVQVFVEPICGRPLSTATEKQETYDEVLTFDRPPYPKTRIGYAR